MDNVQDIRVVVVDILGNAVGVRAVLLDDDSRAKDGSIVGRRRRPAVMAPSSGRNPGLEGLEQAWIWTLTRSKRMVELIVKCSPQGVVLGAPVVPNERDRRNLARNAYQC